MSEMPGHYHEHAPDTVPDVPDNPFDMPTEWDQGPSVQEDDGTGIPLPHEEPYENPHEDDPYYEQHWEGEAEAAD